MAQAEARPASDEALNLMGQGNPVAVSGPRPPTIGTAHQQVIRVVRGVGPQLPPGQPFSRVLPTFGDRSTGCVHRQLGAKAQISGAIKDGRDLREVRR